MTDREMLLIAYGSMKAIGNSYDEDLIKMIEEHIFNPKHELKEKDDSYYGEFTDDIEKEFIKERDEK